MAAKLRFIAVVAGTLLLCACSAPWSSGGPRATRTPIAVVTPSASSVVEHELTQSATAIPSATPTSAIVPTNIASPTLATTTVAPTPTPTPTPSITESHIARCCGVFSWIDARHLLVFDNPAGGQVGAWVMDVSTGARRYLSSNFGLPSRSGLISIPDPAAGQTEIRRVDGSVVATIKNGGVLTWISPDGTRVVWLEDVGVRQVSSLVPRTVRLWSAAIDDGNARPILEFRAAAVQWLPDSRHVVALGRMPDGSEPGVWLIDTTTGSNGVDVAGTFLQALRLSNDGSRMAYLETLSGESSQDGVWVANTNGTGRVHLRETGSYRWAGDASHLWFLDLAPREGGNDSLVLVDVQNDSVVQQIDLGGRVLNDQWEMSPDGSAVAYWSEADLAVIVKALPR
jgi:hypothetical protein